MAGFSGLFVMADQFCKGISVTIPFLWKAMSKQSFPSGLLEGFGGVFGVGHHNKSDEPVSLPPVKIYKAMSVT